MTGAEIAVVVIGLALAALLTAGIVRVVRKRAGESLAPAAKQQQLEEADEPAALPAAEDETEAEAEAGAAAEPEAEPAAEPAAGAGAAAGSAAARAKLARSERATVKLDVAAPARPETTVAPLKIAQPQDKPTLRAVPAEAPVRPLRSGLAKTRGGFIAKLGRLFTGKKKIDEELLGKLEEVLFTADIGVKTSQRLFDALRGELSKSELKDPDAVWGFIRDESIRILDLAGGGAIDATRARPFVILTIGVNGVGKTTTIGKLAALLQREGKKVLLAAGDTFRAAAVEQLEVWGQRTGAPVVKGKEGGDPSSVVFDAVKRAQADGYDVVIADTAGRLHTKVNLMEELQKVRRVCDKASPGAPHETLLVLDATNGQNAISQALTFKQAMDFTGIVLTKLDGTAKGGVILGICNELKIPVRYIGVGERVDDLRPFDAAEFVTALYEKADEAGEEAS